MILSALFLQAAGTAWDTLAPHTRGNTPLASVYAAEQSVPAMPKIRKVHAVRNVQPASQKQKIRFTENLLSEEEKKFLQENAEESKSIYNIAANTEIPDTTSPARKLPAGFTEPFLQSLREQNGGRLAPLESLLPTTAQSVPAAFYGLDNQKSVEAILQALASSHSRGTFFVWEKEIRLHADIIQRIVNSGQEVGICISPRPEDDFIDISAAILHTRQMLKDHFGIETALVRQYNGAVSDVTREAISATGCRLFGAHATIVQNRHKAALSAEEVMSSLFGKNVTSMMRGGILLFRLNYYEKPELAADVFRLLKRTKIDSIAYNAYNDVYGVNPANDSGYKITSIGDILADTPHSWAYPIPEENLLPQLDRTPLLPSGASHARLVDVMQHRYIGTPEVKDGRRALGFSNFDFEKLDTSGRIKTDTPVIFFGFDDWGFDKSINQILYVLRKHKVPGNFFILTHNVPANPNLLRTIAMEGHDIASHTNFHKAMTSSDQHHRPIALQSYEEYYHDVNLSYERMRRVIGDLAWADGTPVLTKFFRPPTLSVNAMGVRAILENGLEYIVSGSCSTEDYAAPDLETEIKTIRDGLYYHGKVRNGAVFVMHMTDAAKYTPYALDVILTDNEKKTDGDPTKFTVGLLSDYLKNGYSQAKSEQDLRKERRKIRWW